jgi:hypothetical protein
VLLTQWEGQYIKLVLAGSLAVGWHDSTHDSGDRSRRITNARLVQKKLAGPYLTKKKKKIGLGCGSHSRVLSQCVPGPGLHTQAPTDKQQIK